MNIRSDFSVLFLYLPESLPLARKIDFLYFFLSLVLHSSSLQSEGKNYDACFQVTITLFMIMQSLTFHWGFLLFKATET